MNFGITKLSFWLTTIGALASACAAATQLNTALSAEATPTFQGLTAGAAPASVSALISIPVGTRQPAIGFILRFAVAFMVMLFAFFVSGLTMVLSIVSSLAFIFGAFMLLMQHLNEAETRGVSRM